MRTKFPIYERMFLRLLFGGQSVLDGKSGESDGMELEKKVRSNILSIACTRHYIRSQSWKKVDTQAH